MKLLGLHSPPYVCLLIEKLFLVVTSIASTNSTYNPAYARWLTFGLEALMLLKLQCKCSARGIIIAVLGIIIM